MNVRREKSVMGALLARCSRDSVSGCWNWTLKKSRDGYGRLGVNDRMFRAHRLMWQEWNRTSIPDGMLVCHRCDNPGCINPAHLFLGTHVDNNADKMAKGRWGGATWVDETGRIGRLQKPGILRERVSEALALCGTKTKQEVARIYGVSVDTIRRLAARKGRCYEV